MTEAEIVLDVMSQLPSGGRRTISKCRECGRVCGRRVAENGTTYANACEEMIDGVAIGDKLLEYCYSYPSRIEFRHSYKDRHIGESKGFYVWFNGIEYCLAKTMKLMEMAIDSQTPVSFDVSQSANPKTAEEQWAEYKKRQSDPGKFIVPESLGESIPVEQKLRDPVRVVEYTAPTEAELKQTVDRLLEPKCFGSEFMDMTDADVKRMEKRSHRKRLQVPSPDSPFDDVPAEFTKAVSDFMRSEFDVTFRIEPFSKEAKDSVSDVLGALEMWFQEHGKQRNGKVSKSYRLAMEAMLRLIKDVEQQGMGSTEPTEGYVKPTEERMPLGHVLGHAIPVALDVSMEKNRALHRVWRALNDGDCPKCHKSFAATEIRRDNHGLHCPSCSFYITHNEIADMQKLFAPAMDAAVNLFETWRKECKFLVS
jgi:hypothetical protein